MTTQQLYADITGCSNIRSVQTESGYSTISATAVIECVDTTLSLGDAVSIDLGYDTAHQNVFDGYVKKIQSVRPEGVYTITAFDTMVRAVDYFLASDDPENPLTFHSASDRDVVNGLLAECGLSLTSGAVAPIFTMGTNADGAKFNLQSVAEAVSFMCSITGRTIYADGGLVYYVNRKPYVDGDSITDTWTTGNQILSCSLELDSSRIRNKISVYGFENIHATASASSPYVVVDQASVLAHPMIDTQEMAQATADVNLALLNRLSQIANIELLGDSSVKPRLCYHVNESFTGLNADGFAYRVEHRMSQDSGFTTSVVLNI